MERQDIDVLLFDLGGVLVEFSGVDDLQTLLRSSLARSEIRDRWIASPVVRSFEVGTLSPAQFATEFVREWDLVVSPPAFLVEFRSWTRGMMPGARELLARLRSRYRLAALSNSNQLHWERNTEELGVTGLFDLALSSHQLGLHKPDPAIYQEAVLRLGTASHRVAFFDDVAANVSAAQNEGLLAFHVAGVDGLEHRLKAEGFL